MTSLEAALRQIHADLGWAENQKHPQTPESGSHDEPSGVGIPQDIADAYVVMRLAELVCEQRTRAVIESALATCGGNGGSLALQKLAGALVGTLEPIESDPAAAEIRILWSKTASD